MKKNLLFLSFVTSILLIGCNNTSSTSSASSDTSSFSSEDSKIIYTASYKFKASFVFEHIKDEEDNNLACLLYDHSYYHWNGGVSIHIEENIVAGDILIVNFESDEEISTYCELTYPSSCYINAKAVSYEFIKTNIISINAETPIKEMAKDIKESYDLNNPYVVLDEEGHYIDIEEYEGHELYLSIDKSLEDYYCSCPEGAQCEPCPTYIAGLYAYNPR